MSEEKKIHKSSAPRLTDWRSKVFVPSQDKIREPADLWRFAMEYFASVDEDPIYITDNVRSGERAGELMKRPAQKPYSYRGFRSYLRDIGVAKDIDDVYYNKRGSYAKFVDVSEAIRDIIYNQKFEGASVGTFNPNIISMDLQMVQRTVDIAIPESQNIDTSLLSDSALVEIAQLSNLRSVKD